VDFLFSFEKSGLQMDFVFFSMTSRRKIYVFMRQLIEAVGTVLRELFIAGNFTPPYKHQYLRDGRMKVNEKVTGFTGDFNTRRRFLGGWCCG